MLKRDKHLQTNIALNTLCFKMEGAGKRFGHGWLNLTQRDA